MGKIKWITQTGWSNCHPSFYLFAKA